MVLKWAFKNFWKCVFVLFFFINGLSAQVNSSEIISVADGLSEGMVFDIIQDKKGFIWIATKYGLNRFDGTDFVTFLQTPEVPYSLPTNQITFLYQDKKERIWLGTSEDKLVLFEPKTQRFYYANLNEGVVNDLPNNFISAIHEDDNGDIWLGSSEGQILKVELSQKLKSSLEGLEPDISSELKVISFKSKLGTDNGIYKIYSVTKYLSWALGDGYFLKIDSKKNSIEYVDVPTNEMGINDNYLFTSFF
jgi:ligand-binding sensor domain-containing protein